MPGGGYIKPLDKILDIEVCKSISPNLKNTITRLSTLLTFRVAVRELKFLTGLAVNHMMAKRITEEVGEIALQITPEPVQFDSKEHLSIQADGGRIRTIDGDGDGWKEVKTAIVAGQEKKLQVSRIQDHKTFMDGFCTTIKSHGYDSHIYGLNGVSDGAQWINDDLEERLPGLILVLDYYHFKEHLYETAEVLYPNDKVQIEEWVKTIKNLAFENKIDEILNILSLEKQMQDKNELAKESLRKLINYVQNNKHKITYGKFKELGYEIGSGKIEATIKNTLDKRMKGASVRWQTFNAQKLLALRDLYFNDQWDILSVKL